MGIRGLQTFIEQKLSLLNEIELHNCNVLFDGNSIYHQMYSECHLTCLFGGEYEKFYRYCQQLFESFQKCRINIIVVFDGARVDDRKLSTTLERSKKRVDFSTKVSVNLQLSPLLLRQTFLHVLHDMNIPYVSALGEGDDECVSLANHLDCYLMSRDSDYYCYNLIKGYIPFDYVDVNPVEADSYSYLSAQLFTIDSLLERFPGLTPSTLSLACCLCGNDYINGNILESIFDHITETVKKCKDDKIGKNNRTKHWYAMQWMRQFDTVEMALEKLSESTKNFSDNGQVERKLRGAFQSYLNPADTLIYRFASSENGNLLRNAHFNQLARDYLATLDMNDEQIRVQVNQNLLALKSKFDHPIPAFLLDGLTDLRLSESFIEVLVHRRLIFAAHVELEREPSIYADAIPIILPCFAMLTKWDNEQDEQSVVIYHRVFKQLKACVYSLTDFEDTIDLTHLHSLSPVERQGWVLRCLKTSQREEWSHLHLDYHFWLMIIQYWYTTRHLTPVYLYAVIISLIKSCYLVEDDTFQSEEMNSLSLPINDRRNYTQIDPNIRRTIHSKLKSMSKKVYDMKKFDCSIIHEFNCLQTIYMFSTKVNDFFNRPFQCPIEPHKFLYGSFFYAFVEHYETKRNLTDALNDLFQKDAKLLTVINGLFMSIS